MSQSRDTVTAARPRRPPSPQVHFAPEDVMAARFFGYSGLLSALEEMERADTDEV